MRSKQALAYWNAFCLVSDLPSVPASGQETIGFTQGRHMSDRIDEDTAFDAAYHYLEEHEFMYMYVLRESLLNFLLLCYEASK